MSLCIRVKQQVEEVTNIMKENVNKLFVRGDHLDELNERSENLRSAADDFHSASSRFLFIFLCNCPFFTINIDLFIFKAKEEYVVERNEDSSHSRIAVHADCDNYDW